MQNETHINDTTRATTNHVFGENIVNIDDVVDSSSKDDGMEIEMVDDVRKWLQSLGIRAEVGGFKPFNEDPFVSTYWLQTDATAAEVIVSIPIPRSDFRRSSTGMVSFFVNAGYLFVTLCYDLGYLMIIVIHTVFTRRG